MRKCCGSITEIRTNFDLVWPESVKHWPTLATIDQTDSKSGQMRPNSNKLGQRLANLGRNWVKVDQHPPIWSDVGRSWPKSGKCWPNFGQNGRASVRPLAPELGRPAQDVVPCARYMAHTNGEAPPQTVRSLILQQPATNTIAQAAADLAATAPRRSARPRASARPSPRRGTLTSAPARGREGAGDGPQRQRRAGLVETSPWCPKSQTERDGECPKATAERAAREREREIIDTSRE